MKKLSLLIAMILCVTIGGVYATWTYTQNTDVADEAIHTTVNLTDVAYSGSYGTYKVDTSTLKLKVDPKENTQHTTALYIEGKIVITFTPNSVAPENVKNNAVPSTFQFSLTNNHWTFDDDTTSTGDEKPIITLRHTDKEDIKWSSTNEGVFEFVITAEELENHITLTEFVLDTKLKYDAFNTALGNGQITITVSDGVAAGQGSGENQTPENGGETTV